MVANKNPSGNLKTTAVAKARDAHIGQDEQDW